MRLDEWQSIEEMLKRGERVFLCFVVAATKGSPGTPGAAIAVGTSVVPMGTIGGGRMELDLLSEAQGALAQPDAAPRCETLYHHAVNSGRASGLICGGSQTHVSLVLRPERDAGTVLAIRTAMSSEQGGSLKVSPLGLRFLPETRRGTHRKFIAGEPDWSYEERLFNARRIAILGGGHCGVALAELMRRLGYAVRVFETRRELHTFKPLPPGEAIFLENFAEAGQHLLWPDCTFAVVMTSAYPTDVDALAGLMPYPFPFIGLMGTGLKIARIREALTKRGFEATCMDRVTAPVGLPMDSDTPEEIAVSVAAQILLTRKDLNLT